jgi:hypothetical protein
MHGWLSMSEKGIRVPGFLKAFPQV